MKPLRPVIAIIVLMLCASASFAQKHTKQPLFTDYPANILCKATVVEPVLQAKEGQHIALNLTESFKFSGTVVSNVLKYGNMQTIVVRSDAFEGALMLISKHKSGKNTVITGRILSPLSSDGYQIKQNAEGAYVFEKIDAAHLLETCAQP